MDRTCLGIMEPIGVWVKKNKECSLIHCCKECGFIRANRIAGDDSEMLLFYLAARPIAQLPFPAEYVLDQIDRGKVK